MGAAEAAGLHGEDKLGENTVVFAQKTILLSLFLLFLIMCTIFHYHGSGQLAPADEVCVLKRAKTFLNINSGKMIIGFTWKFEKTSNEKAEPAEDLEKGTRYLRILSIPSQVLGHP